VSTTESIALIGMILVFLTTVVGWLFTYRTQKAIQVAQLSAAKDLAHLEDQLTSRREQAQLMIADRLEILKEIEGWIQLGREIYLEAYGHSQRGDSRLPDARALAMYESVGPKLRELRAKAPRYYYLARLWDPISSLASKWQWGTAEPPEDLPQVLWFYEDEVSDQVGDALFGPRGRERPFIEDQFHGLHEAAIRAIERLNSQTVSKSASQ
jgi:hypothetical protein